MTAETIETITCQGWVYRSSNGELIREAGDSWVPWISGARAELPRTNAIPVEATLTLRRREV